MTNTNKTFKKTVVKATGDNGVFHDVYSYADGTITAHKIIDGKVVQTYDWSGTSRESLMNMFTGSGHQEYTLYEEIEEAHERRVELKEVIAEVRRKADWFADEVTASVSVWEYEDERTGVTEFEVCVLVYDDEQAIEYDVTTDVYSNEKKAFARAKHIAKKLRESFSFDIEYTGEIIHGVM